MSPADPCGATIAASYSIGRMVRRRVWIVAACAGFLVGCGRQQPVKVWDAHLWRSGLPLPVRRTDFPTKDSVTYAAAERVTPTTIGSALLRWELLQSQTLRDFVREHDLPDGVLLTHGPHLELYYLGTDQTYVFAISKTQQLEVVETKPLAGADRAALQMESHRERAARELRSDLDRLARVYRVGRQMQRVMPAQELLAYDPGFVAIELTPVSRALFNVPDAVEGVVIALVHPDSPAAGTLKAGDVIVQVGEQAVHGFQDYRLDVTAAGVALHLAAAPGRRIVIEPERVSLPFAVQLVKTPIPGAFSKPELIIVTDGMLDLVENDDQLAVVLGHEFAHRAAGHMHLSAVRVVTAALTLPVSIVPLVGPFVTAQVVGIAQRFDRDQERTADRLGIEYAARAGYDPAAAVRVFELLERSPLLQSMQPFYDVHPPYPERIAAAKATAAALRH